MSGYTTREVADLIGLKQDQVRHYVRRRLLRPDRGSQGEYRFNFQDIVLLRSAKGLLDAQVSPRKAYKVLLKLQQDLAQSKSLSSLRVFADGSAVVLQEDSQMWNVESGQGHLDFSVGELADNVADLANRNLIVAKESDDMTSDDWYNLALDLEEVDPNRAPDAYRQALRLDPQNADAHVNLGRLHQLQGDLRKAKRHYQRAVDVAPKHQLALYNLGTVFDELDEMETAAEYYRRSLAIPDAHYNLSRICELRGDELSALRHMRRYRDLLDQER